MDTAILRALQAIHGGCRYLCGLDLKQAYASVPRRYLIRRLRQVLPEYLVNMDETMVFRPIVETRGDITQTRREMVRGVSPLSPSLFNIFIDPLAGALKQAAVDRWHNPLNLFADNIVLLAPTAGDMQKVLDVCGDWATRNGLTWGCANATRLRLRGRPNRRCFSTARN